MVKGLETLKNQVILSTILMIVVPLTTFFYMRNKFYKEWMTKEVEDKGQKEVWKMQGEVDTWAALSAIGSVQVLIFAIIIIKYSEDILDVFVNDRGHIPYEEQTKNSSSKKSKQKKVKVDENGNNQEQAGGEEEDDTTQMKKKNKKKKKKHNKKHLH